MKQSVQDALDAKRLLTLWYKFTGRPSGIRLGAGGVVSNPPVQHISIMKKVLDELKTTQVTQSCISENSLKSFTVVVQRYAETFKSPSIFHFRDIFPMLLSKFEGFGPHRMGKILAAQTLYHIPTEMVIVNDGVSAQLVKADDETIVCYITQQTYNINDLMIQ